MNKIFALLCFSIFSLAFLVGGCEDDTLICPDNAIMSLSTFLECHADRAVSKNLIACAAGGQIGILDDPDFPVSIFFLPVEGAHNFMYFETDPAKNVDPDNLAQFLSYRGIEDRPVFNGYLRRFLHPSNFGNSENWGRVVYFTEDSVHISNAIRIKNGPKPTEFSNASLQINLDSPTEPAFQWEDGRTPENAIYFQVVSDSAQNLISGTYTFEKNFQFYNLSNVVLNVRDVQPPPTLQEGQRYNFTLMGVSLDNWVNLIQDSSFVARN